MINLIKDNLIRAKKTQAFIMNKRAQDGLITFKELDQYLNYIKPDILITLIANDMYWDYDFSLPHISHALGYTIDFASSLKL